MFHHLSDCAQNLTEKFEETFKTEGRIIIESKNIFGRFTADSISSTALGFKGNCIKEENSKVFELAQNIQDDFSGTSGLLKMMLVQMFPTLAKLLGIKIFRQSTHDFFKKYVNDEIVRRESQGITSAKDVIQMLIQAKNGQLKHDEDPEYKVERQFTNWNDDELIAAQIFVFFAGGFETTSSLMQMCSWELAMNQDIQTELMREVDEVLKTLEGKTITYEALNNMKLLDMVVNETLRKWPPLPFGGRDCNGDYKLNTKDGKVFILRKGDQIFIPFRSIQHDPKYFENPSKFDPYRFSDENKNKIVPGSFLAFGYGQRLCLGARLALLEAKLVFFTILSKYSIKVCEKTPKEVNYGTSPVSYKEKVFVELKTRTK